MSFLVTLDTFSRLVHFKLIHNKVMTNKILFKMNLADSFKCVFCYGEETVRFMLFLSAKMLLNSGITFMVVLTFDTIYYAVVL